MDIHESSSTEVPVHKAFDAFTEIFEKIGSVAREKGTRPITIIAGIVMLIFIFVKHVFLASPKDRAVIDYIDLTLVLCAVAITAMGLLISSFEYKVYVDSRNKDKQLLFAKYKMELEYNLKRLEMTDLTKVETGNNVETDLTINLKA